MRGIGKALSRRSFKLSAELRLYAACSVLKFSFSSGHMSQHCVQPLWTQDHESEQKHEQDFRTEPHDLLLGQAALVGNGGCGDWLLVLGFHG